MGTDAVGLWNCTCRPCRPDDGMVGDKGMDLMELWKTSAGTRQSRKLP